jgi:hypothetical protein
MGIITSVSHPAERSERSEGSCDKPRRVGIQGLLLWPVRNLDIHRYEKELDRMQCVYGKLDQKSDPS